MQGTNRTLLSFSFRKYSTDDRRTGTKWVQPFRCGWFVNNDGGPTKQTTEKGDMKQIDRIWIDFLFTEVQFDVKCVGVYVDVWIGVIASNIEFRQYSYFEL